MAKKNIIKNMIKEELKKQLNETYTSDSIRDFLRRNDTSSQFLPTIKFFGEKGDSKHLSLSWDMVEKIADLIEKEAISGHR